MAAVVTCQSWRDCVLRFSAWCCLHAWIDDSTAYGNLRQCYNVKVAWTLAWHRTVPRWRRFSFPDHSFACALMSFNILWPFPAPAAHKPYSGRQDSHCSTGGLSLPGALLLPHQNWPAHVPSWFARPPAPWLKKLHQRNVCYKPLHLSKL